MWSRCLSRIRLRVAHRCAASSSSTNRTQLSNAEREANLLSCLKEVTLPNIDKSIYDVGCLQSVKVDTDGNVALDLDFLVPGYPHKNIVESSISQVIGKFSWVSNIKFNYIRASLNQVVSSSSNQDVLRGIDHIIAVSSCKGGVGKSTVAANLAVTLAKRGLRVGILDADIFGPSLPHLIQPSSKTVRRSTRNSGNIMPLTSKEHGISMISFGFVNARAGVPGSGGQTAAVMRGAMATKVIIQLLLNTEWGVLDYLIIDFPPGTGDIQLTLSQNAPISGAVVVTTPHTLSLVDAAKGIRMFTELKIPTLSVVENMSYFIGDHGKKYFPFGVGGKKKLVRSLSAAKSDTGTSDSLERLALCPFISFPLSVENSSIEPENHVESSYPVTQDNFQTEIDTLRPIVCRLPNSESAGLYNVLADSVIEELFKLQLEVFTVPTARYISSRESIVVRYFTVSSAVEYVVPLAELPGRDRQTGEHLPKDFMGNKSRLQIGEAKNVRIEKKGSYGLGVSWNDSNGQNAEIFTFEALKRIALDIVGNA